MSDIGDPDEWALINIIGVFVFIVVLGFLALLAVIQPIGY